MSHVQEIISPQPVAPIEMRSESAPRLALSMPWAVLVSTVIVAAHLPLLVLHGWHLLDRVQYGFFPLVPVGAFFLARQRLRGIGQLVPGNCLLFSLMLGVSFSLTAFAVLVFSPWSGAVAFLFALLAFGYGLGGWIAVGRLLPAWLFMWFTIPLPFNYDQRLILSLQTVTAKWSSRLLDTVNVLHVLSGNTVEIPGHKLLVEEACSGVRSLFVILAFTAFFVAFFRVRFLRAVLLLAGSVVFVVIANVVRVVVITALTVKGWSVVEGLPHELLGIGVFLLAMGMVLSFDRLLLFFLPPKGAWYKTRGEQLREESSKVLWPNWQATWLANWVSIPAMGLYAALVVAQLYLLWPASSHADQQALAAETTAAEQSKITFDKLTADQLPANWNGWHRLDFVTKSRPRFEAQLSRYWAYRAGNNKVVASIDYPFVDWHDLLICYQAVGWSIEDQTVHGPDSEPQAPYLEVTLNQSNLQHGYLLFYLFDSAGRPLERRTFTATEKLKERIGSIRENWRAAGENLASGKRQEYYQFQVFVESYGPLSDKEREQARDFYRLACQKLCTQWLPDVRQPAAEDSAAPEAGSPAADQQQPGKKDE